MRKYKVDIDPLGEFARELDSITGEIAQHIASTALLQLPDYFFVIPASSSGKYHPKSSIGIGGLVRHTKAVFAIGEELLRHPLYAPFDEETKDNIKVAILLHDGFKSGVNGGEHTVPEHPLLLRNNIKPLLGIPVGKDIEEQEVMDTWSVICDLIETHMGIWNKNKEGKEILKVPTSDPQVFVHLCDYLASRKRIEVDTHTRNSSSLSSPSWKTEPATLVSKGGKLSGQIPYIEKLYKMCAEKGMRDLPEIVYMVDGKVTLTKGEATDIIEELKRKLGQK